MNTNAAWPASSKSIRIIQAGLTALVLVMPFHAFLSIWLGHLFTHQAVFQAWKELLILGLVIVGSVWLIRHPRQLARLNRPYNWLALSYLLVALVVSLIAGVVGTNAFWYGVKTDLVFLVVFGLAQLAADPSLKLRLTKILLITSGVVATLAVIQTWLPNNFLTRFGYGPLTILPVQTVDPAIRAVRAFATLGGPNQLGAFLVLPISLLVYLMLKRWRWWQPAILALEIWALYLTYSRSAWIGAAVAILVVIMMRLPKRWALGLALVATVSGAILLGQIDRIIEHYPRAQYYLLHTSNKFYGVSGSDAQRSQAISDSLDKLAARPWGRGLGSAGPASRQGDQPLISENYFLQIGLETGWLGLGLFSAFLVLTARALYLVRNKLGLATPLLAALAGLTLTNLLLHAWADSSLALVYWTLVGVTLGQTS